MQYSDAGRIAEQCWNDIPNHFPNTRLHAWVIMPNHVHGIIEIIQSENDFPSVGAKNVSPPERTENIPPRPQSPSRTIGSIVRGFKIGVTKWMRNNPSAGAEDFPSIIRAEDFPSARGVEDFPPQQRPIWQRNYYDHIIRNQRAFDNISNYIIQNPTKWWDDTFHV